MVRLLLVRHGETAWNAAGRFQGHTDVPLNAAGKRQAVALTRLMAVETVHALYVSDLQRAWETARMIAAPLGLTAQPEPLGRVTLYGDTSL